MEGPGRTSALFVGRNLGDTVGPAAECRPRLSYRRFDDEMRTPDTRIGGERRARTVNEGLDAPAVLRIGQRLIGVPEGTDPAAIRDDECPAASQARITVAMRFEPTGGLPQVFNEVVVFHRRLCPAAA